MLAPALPLLLATLSAGAKPHAPRRAETPSHVTAMHDFRLVVSDTLSLKRDGERWTIFGKILVLRDGKPTTDVEVTLNGVRLRPSGESFVVEAQNPSPGMQLAFRAQSRGDSAALDLRCAPELALISPTPGATVRPGETLHLAWRPLNADNEGVRAYFRGQGNDSTAATVPFGASAMALDVPASARGRSTIALFVRGAFEDDARPGNSCSVQQPLELVVDGPPVVKAPKQGRLDPPDFLPTPQRPYLPLDPSPPVAGAGNVKVIAAWQGNPVSVAADEAAVYWTNSDHHTHGSLVRQPKDGPQQLLRRERQHRYYGLQARGGFLYFLDERLYTFEKRVGDGQALLRVPATGGAAEVVLPQQPLTGFSVGAEGVVASTGICRFTAPSGFMGLAGEEKPCTRDRLLFAPRGGGAPLTLAEGLGDVTSVLLSRGMVWFTSGRTVWRVPVAGGKPIAAFERPGVPTSLAIAPNGLKLAWVEWRFPMLETLTVVAADLASEAPPRELGQVSWNASAFQFAPTLALDDESAFVASALVGKLLRMPLVGGPSSAVATHQWSGDVLGAGPAAPVISGSRLLWVDCHQDTTNLGYTWWGRDPPAPPAATVNALDL